MNNIAKYLDKCAENWDKKPRLDHVATLFGVDIADRLSTENLRLFMVQAVGRAVVPGCIADYALLLQGAQGLGKSRALEHLFGRENYYQVSLADPDLPIDTWCLEIEGPANPELLKFQISTRNDRYREPYKRIVSDYPRRCVFAVTTSDDHLADKPRHFLPVRVTSPTHPTGITFTRDQIWGEIRTIYGK